MTETTTVTTPATTNGTAAPKAKPAPKPVNRVKATAAKPAPKAAKKPVKATVARNEGPTVEQFLNAVKTAGTSGREAVAKKLGLSVDQVKNRMGAARAKGLVKRNPVQEPHKYEFTLTAAGVKALAAK